MMNASILADVFMPHGMCYLWKPSLVGLHLVSNTIIALSYFSIPITLIRIVRKRTDIPFNYIFLLFAGFIVFCGSGHLLDIWTLWHPNYWISGAARAMTALISFATALTLIQLFPQIVAFPSPSQLKEANPQLQQNQQFLNAVLESLSDGIVACNAEGVLTLFNQAAETFHALPAEPIPSEQWSQHYDLYRSDGQTPLTVPEIPLFRALQGEIIRDVEVVIAPKQQSPYLVLTNGQPIVSVTGDKLGAVVAMRDITKQREAEVLLQEQEEFLRSIYTGVDISIFVIDVIDEDFRIFNCNPTCEKLTGITLENVSGKTIEVAFSPEIAAEVRSHYQDCINAGHSISYEEFLPFQGKETWWLTRLNPIRNEQGKIYRLIGTSFNITERKYIESKLQQSLERYQLVADNSSDLITTRTPAGNYFYVSPACRQLLGYEPEELMGQSFYEFLHPEDASALQRTESILSQLPDQYVQSYRMRRQDGTFIWLETTNRLTDAVEHDSGIIIAISRDITERKQAEVAIVRLNQELEQALAKGNDRLKTVSRLYQTVVNSVKEIIFRTDQTGRWIFLNSAWTEITGLTVEESLNTLFSDYIYSEKDRQRTTQLFQDLIQENRESWIYEFRCLTQRETFCWLEMCVQLNRNEEGEVLGTIGTLNDITDRKQTEAILKSRADELAKQRQQLEVQNLQLQEASQLKSQFLATMSHELRTPMNAIMGFSQMLQTQKYGELTNRQQDMINRILDNSQNLLEMVNEVLDFSKLEADRVQLSPEPFNINKFIQLTVGELRSLADKKNLTLEMQIEPLDDYQVINDKKCLRRILINLISNAIKFTPKGRVRVELKEVNLNRLAISVSDTGIGIKSEYLETIFEAFRQVDQSLTRNHPGTGLG
ncbi:MAG: PAS domain S-box protein, partial [Cyanobacteriota bacterium]|nr:PAS domain S-box protein [Cyanobacteriota bacterium]